MLMLSMHDSEQYLFEALQGGRVGLRAEVGRRPRPGRGVPGGDARRAVPLPGGGDRADPRLPARRAARTPADPLTPRELQVAQADRRGAHERPDRRASSSISRRTVDRHRENILAKLGMRDRVELTRYAIRRGLDRALRWGARTAPGWGRAPIERRRRRRRASSRVARLRALRPPPRRLCRGGGATLGARAELDAARDGDGVAARRADPPRERRAARHRATGTGVELRAARDGDAADARRRATAPAREFLADLRLLGMRPDALALADGTSRSG